MSSTNQSPPPSRPGTDVFTKEPYATITCPSCQGTLRVAAHLSAAAPCPICAHPLHYEPPHPVETQVLAPMRRREPRTQETTDPVQPPPSTGLRARINDFNEFLNSRLGIAVSWCIVAALSLACVLLYLQWSKERAQHSLRMESIESQRPPASRPAEGSPVPLLPGEPAPVHPPQAPR